MFVWLWEEISEFVACNPHNIPKPVTATSTAFKGGGIKLQKGQIICLMPHS